jgi:hypothetical protein
MEESPQEVIIINPDLALGQNKEIIRSAHKIVMMILKQ